MDKQLHFLWSFFLTLFLVFLGFKTQTAMIIVLGIGIAKEALDQLDYGGWSWWDLFFDAMGIVVAYLIILYT